jgi:hypothetical protein
VEKEGSSSLGVDVERSEASTTSSIRRARGESREGNGGGSARVCHAAEGERKKEGAAWGRQPDHGAGMAPSGVVGGDSTCSRRRRAGEQGRAAGRC